MALILYKWLFLATTWISHPAVIAHPIYVSVTEIEHNAADKTLEISCKIFTDDLEKTLREVSKVHIDLINPTDKKMMEKMLSDYVSKHLLINANGKNQQLKFKGYEQIEEAIYSYYEVDNIPVLKNITVTDNILFEYKSEQMSLLHVIVNGERKSTRLINPVDKVSFEF